MLLATPWKIILVGFILVLLGAVLPLLMVLQILRSTYFLNFFSYAATTCGLALGVIGAAMHVKLKK